MKATLSETTDWRERCRKLERLAAQVLQPIGLRHRRTRLRRIHDGHLVVDTLFESNRLHFGAWHVRCVGSSQLTLDDVATEVGIAQGSGNRVAVLIATGKISAAARKYSDVVNGSTPYNVILLRTVDLSGAGTRRTRLARLIHRQAPAALSLAAHPRGS